jgi:hypothetical protein
VLPEAESQPVHPSNVLFKEAAAVSVTGVLFAYVAEHVAPQLIPAGELVTVPVPVPVRLTVRTLCVVVKVAVTLRALFIVTEHWLPELESHPPQTVKADVPSGVAVSVTKVPLL